MNPAWRHFSVGLILCVCLMALASCRTAPPFGEVNVQSPEWSVRQGQAVWQRPPPAPEIAGEVLLATRTDGRAFVQFSKNGFPLLTAQSETGRWEADIPAQNKRYSGRGAPPQRLLILYLPIAMRGEPLPRPLSWTPEENGGWRLKNDRTGEALEGYFNP
jgi:hypothetical protein